ncbi:MAG: glucose-1-phosphate adenylyltransferase [Planctomycetaceae bacterium]|uniref:Glucose-1-phosphate adenylyltransferase n=1 Tax=Lacipirellula limnantheis TaxID=2528024 RepID=A0A517U6N7_9BACT|nr:glucose-1-phosphate adenylyltransferase [Lacipirellula limnantheis]MBL9163946.1 glucose-1-phosphate adenylyltransferase [Planctomycetaceae bacterium]QDT76298.1 Glucose-1-phosphate adenylyltransferase [Lacipirellula limnantheis]
MKDVLAVVLAGGKGSRLEPLTRDRAKPAVPFGGIYRIIDFTLSNCLNSGIRKILVLTQYKAMSLARHVTNGWRHLLCRELGEFIDVVPPQQRIDEQWYQGTADAVYQNIYTLEQERPKYVVILAGDHIYKMDYSKMVAYHEEMGADLTIGALRVTPKEAREFGVMQIDEGRRIIGFEEKVPNPKTIPGDPDHCLASMGIYVFNAPFLFDQLCQDATLPESAHDFGRNIIPSIIKTHKVMAFPFHDENSKKDAYWKDVGTLDAYFEANIELTAVDPLLNLYDYHWPVRTDQPNLPPPKFVFDENSGRRGEAHDSIVAAGTIIAGGHVTRSIIGPKSRVEERAEVTESILFSGVHIGKGAIIRRAIIDKNVFIPDGAQVGVDHEADRRRGFEVTEKGVTVIPTIDGSEALFSR